MCKIRHRDKNKNPYGDWSKTENNSKAHKLKKKNEEMKNKKNNYI